MNQHGSKLQGLRTEMASKATVFAAVLSAKFIGFSIGRGGWVFELKAPEGQSTDGGKQARQNIRLVPRQPGFSEIVVGTLDPVTNVAEIRAFEHVAQVHQERFKRPFEMSRQEYHAFLTKLDAELRGLQIQWRNVPPPAGVQPLITEKKGAGARVIAIVAVVVVVLAALGFAAFRFLG